MTVFLDLTYWTGAATAQGDGGLAQVSHSSLRTLTAVVTERVSLTHLVGCTGGVATHLLLTVTW